MSRMGPDNLHFNKPFRAGGLGIVLPNPVWCSLVGWGPAGRGSHRVCLTGYGSSCLPRMFAFAASN